MKTTTQTQPTAYTPIDQLPTPYEVSWNGPRCLIFANTPGKVTPVCEILAYSQSGKGKASTADFVALACNAHAELLAALEHALADLECLNVGHATIEDVCGIIPEIRAAIAKASA